MMRIFVVMGLIGLSACTPEVKRPSVNQPPLPVLAAPETAQTGEPVFIDGSASTDVDGILSDVFLLTGDGADPVIDFSTTHTFEEPGQYLVELYVKDNAGAGARARHRIVVVDR